MIFMLVNSKKKIGTLLFAVYLIIKHNYGESIYQSNAKLSYWKFHRELKVVLSEVTKKR
jgi:hypothetical protein